jgi:PIN domain nuclease of toxin-antitoxin system
VSGQFLVDTNVVIWTLQGSSRVSASARNKLADSKVSLLISTVSVWEIILKAQAGKLHFNAALESVIDQIVHRFSWTLLPLLPSHLADLVALPLLHKDPFDRMLIAQSQSEQLTIITPDQHIRKYDVQTLW